MYWADGIGVAEIYRRTAAWHQRYGERWAPAALLRHLAETNPCCVPEDWRDSTRLWQAVALLERRLQEEAQFVPVVHRRDPRARTATPAGLAGQRVGGACGPTGASVSRTGSVRNFV
jgi:hypothetical protein